MPDALEFMATLTTAARALRTRLDQEFAPLGVTSQQAGVLLHIGSGIGGVRELREAMRMDAAGMTRLLDRLESRRLIVRAAASGDRRATVVALTDAGARLIPTIPPVFGRLARLLDAIPDADLGTALTALRALIPLLESTESERAR